MPTKHYLNNSRLPNGIAVGTISYSYVWNVTSSKDGPRISRAGLNGYATRVLTQHLPAKELHDLEAIRDSAGFEFKSVAHHEGEGDGAEDVDYSESIMSHCLVIGRTVDDECQQSSITIATPVKPTIQPILPAQG